jgi:putative NADH-flavin reductase
MKMAVFGATGDTGRRLCRRALDAGHEVRAFSGSRREIVGVDELTATPFDFADDAAVDAALSGVDAIVSTLGGPIESRLLAIRALIDGAERASVRRIVAVGGAGILRHPSGVLVNETPGYPAFLVAISRAHLRTYELLRESTLDFTMACPGTMREGPSEGAYRHRPEQILEDLRGVLYDDVAHLLLRCLDERIYVRERVSISNP